MIYFGDCVAVMKELIASGVKVQTCVTSPPYWGLRDYGVAGQLGLEAVHDCLGWATGSPCGDCHVCRIVEVFRLVRDLLTGDGTCWINYGDCYASQGGAGWQGKHGDRANRRHTQHVLKKRSAINGLKPKDLVMMPARVALALQSDGWYLRQDIVWHKPNPMPESVKDRCTKAHEYLFLLAKSQQYYFDQNAIKEPCSENTHARRAGNGHKTPDGWDTSSGSGAHGSFHRHGREKGDTGYRHKLPGNKSHKGTTAYDNGDDKHRTKGGLVRYAEKLRKLADAGSGVKNNESMDSALAVMPDLRNKRSVWSIATQPFSDAHFATFPEALVTPCILAGSRPGDIVLDPFIGSGTTAVVAERLGRRYVDIELNQSYRDIQAKRLRQRSLFVGEK